MGLITIEAAAERMQIAEPWRLRDLAVLGGAPQAYGPMRVQGSDFRVMLDSDDLAAWDAAGRPVADSRYRAALAQPQAIREREGGRSIKA